MTSSTPRSWKHPLLLSTARAAAFVLTVHQVNAVTLNLTDVTVNSIPPSTYAGNDNQNHDGGFINGALFQRNSTGSGSGQYRLLFRMSDDNDPDRVELGYNRDGVMDSQAPNGFDPLLRVANLTVNSEGGYYQFSLDANESGGGGNNYLSLDMFSSYVGGTNDPVPLPNTEATLSQLGTRVYSFTANDAVLIDANTGTGSGTADMFVFVPTSLFDGFAPDSFVYIFASHGAYNAAGFDSSGGFEEWASVKTSVPAFVPEPFSAPLAVLGGLLLVNRRRVNPRTRGHDRKAPKNAIRRDSLGRLDLPDLDGPEGNPAVVALKGDESAA